MKRGGFWMTTVAATAAVMGLMTVGRAGLKSQAVLFLQGQMKIAAGDTDSGLKLLAAASSRPHMGQPDQYLETVSQPVKASKPEKSCKGWSLVLPRLLKTSRTEQVSVKIKPAPEPTLASLTLIVPAPPMVQSPYAQDAVAYTSVVVREALRVQQAEIKRAQCIREEEMKKAFREISSKQQANTVPSAREIQMQVENGLGTVVQ